MGEIIYYIAIFPLEQLLSWIFIGLNGKIDNYGVSIIVLSLIINIFLLKIFLYTDRKAKEESELKARLDERIKGWKSVYKKAKLYAFTRTLYRQNNYNPIYSLRSLGGLAIQIPFFWAMYLVVKEATYLEGVSFLWIDDLSKPDVVLGVHLLPILMSLFTLVNVFLSSKERGARIQGVIITIVFLVLLYEMPSALVLYWTINMAFSLFKTILHSSFSDKAESLLFSHCDARQVCLIRSKHHNSAFSSKILECEKLASENLESSLRESETNEAIHNAESKSVESKFIYCHDSAFAESRNDKNTESNFERSEDSAQSAINATKSQTAKSVVGGEGESCERGRGERLRHSSPLTLSQSKINGSEAIHQNEMNNRNEVAERNTESKNIFLRIFNKLFTPYNSLTPNAFKNYKDSINYAWINSCFLICIVSPFAVYSSDVTQFDVEKVFQTLGGLVGAFVLFSFIFIYLSSFAYRTRALKSVVFFASLLLFIGLINVFIMVGDYGAMDHFIIQNPTFTDKANKPIWIRDAIITGIIAIVLVIVLFKYLSIIFKILFITLFTLNLVSIVKIYLASADIIKSKAEAEKLVESSGEIKVPYEKELFSYSKNDKNIVIFVLDMFDGSHTPYIFKQFPHLKEPLDGFTLFDNTFSTTNATIHSVATLIGGEYYSVYNMNARKDNLADSIIDAYIKIGKNFVENGYAVSYFLGLGIAESAKHIKQKVPKIFTLDNMEEIFTSYFLEKENLITKYNEAEAYTKHIDDLSVFPKMISFGVFRFAPEISRRDIYKSGKWLSPYDAPSLSATASISSFYAFTHIGNTESEKPTFKFLHSAMTHRPHFLYFDNNQCDYFSNKTAWENFMNDKRIRKFAKGRKAHYQQYDTEACSLTYLAYYIKWLKDNDIYDNTQIFVVSDHGGGAMLDNVPYGSESLLLFKDFNARGKMQTDSRLMTNYDPPSIFCENLSNGCPNIPHSILKNYPYNREVIHTQPTHWILERHKPNQWIINKYFTITGEGSQEENWQDITESVKNGTFKLDGIEH